MDEDEPFALLIAETVGQCLEEEICKREEENERRRERG